MVKAFFISPQLGAFASPQNHRSFIINVDIGYARENQKGLYIAPALGVGYLFSSHILSNTIDLSGGEVTDRNREARNAFLPTVNMELGKNRIGKTGWYTKLTYGKKLFSVIEESGFFAIELGLKFFIKNTKD